MQRTTSTVQRARHTMHQCPSGRGACRDGERRPHRAMCVATARALQRRTPSVARSMFRASSRPMHATGCGRMQCVACRTEWPAERAPGHVASGAQRRSAALRATGGAACDALAASEMDVVTLVDVSMLLLPPASGDELQVCLCANQIRIMSLCGTTCGMLRCLAGAEERDCRACRPYRREQGADHRDPWQHCQCPKAHYQQP